MTDMNIGFGEVREFNPKAGNIDWEEAWIANHDGEIQHPVWVETVDELGKFCEQLHQENCVFYINDTTPEFDAIIINDPRDENGDFWISRYAMGSDEFDELYEKIGSEVMTVFTKYPPLQVAEYIIKLLSEE